MQTAAPAWVPLATPWPRMMTDRPDCFSARDIFDGAAIIES